MLATLSYDCDIKLTCIEQRRLRARLNIRIDYSIALQCHAPAPSPELVAVKTMQINLESLVRLSTKLPAILHPLVLIAYNICTCTYITISHIPWIP